MWVFCALWFLFVVYFFWSLCLLCDLSCSCLVAFSLVSLTCIYVCSCGVYTFCRASVVGIIILWLHNIIPITLWLRLCYVVFVSLNCSFFNANYMFTNFYNSIYCVLCLLWPLLLDYRWLPHLRRRKILQRRLTKDWKWTMICLGPFNILRDTKILSWKES